MTGFGTVIALVGAGAVAAGGVLGAEADGRDGSAERTALVVDASAARDGRSLVDDRLRAADVELRLPRTPPEARTNVRYFHAQDYRVVVAGPLAGAAAHAAGVAAVRARGVAGALAAIRR